jgi:hypothetical protein
MALSSPLIVWAVAFHIASHHHHVASSGESQVGLQLALHGHEHDGDTPAHGHPLIASVAGPIPAKHLLLIAFTAGDAPEVVAATASGRRPWSSIGPTHDPPPRAESFSVLRI